MRSGRIKNRQAIERVLFDAANEVELLLAVLFEHPDDVEANHKFRVSIRTLRALIDFIKPFQSAAQNRRMQANLRGVVLETSRLREIDVFSELVAEDTEAQGCPPAADSRSDLQKVCDLMREEELERTLAALGSKKARRALRDAYYDARNIAWKGDIATEGIPKKDVTGRFDELVAAQNARQAALDPMDVELTHKVRKKAKQVRYAASEFGMLLGDDALRVAKDMKHAQDDLGAYCDALVNLQMIDEFPREGLSLAGRRQLYQLAERNAAYLEEALAGFQAKQHEAADSAAEEAGDASAQHT